MRVSSSPHLRPRSRPRPRRRPVGPTQSSTEQRRRRRRQAWRRARMHGDASCLNRNAKCASLIPIHALCPVRLWLSDAHGIRPSVPPHCMECFSNAPTPRNKAPNRQHGPTRGRRGTAYSSLARRAQGGKRSPAGSLALAAPCTQHQNSYSPLMPATRRTLVAGCQKPKPAPWAACVHGQYV